MFSKVKSDLEALAKTLGPVSDEEAEACPVCLSPPAADDRTRLEFCGHVYCGDCLKMQINSSGWPLVCAVEVKYFIKVELLKLIFCQNCDSQLVVADFKFISSDEGFMKRFHKNALDHKLARHDSSLRACPSPNCKGVFRTVEQDEEELEIESFFCGFCGVNICRR